MIVCGDFFYCTKYGIEHLEVLPCPTRSICAGVYAGTHAEPLYSMGIFFLNGTGPTFL